MSTITFYHHCNFSFLPFFTGPDKSWKTFIRALMGRELPSPRMWTSQVEIILLGPYALGCIDFPLSRNFHVLYMRK